MGWTFHGGRYEWSAAWFQGWGAILQAVLTVASVWAVVWIDRRSTRRHEREIRAERARAHGDRRRAVQNAWSAVENLIRELGEVEIPEHGYAVASEDAQRIVRAAADVIQAYLRSPTEIDGLLLATLAHADQVLERVLEIYPLNREVRPSTRFEVVGHLTRQALRLNELMTEYDNRIW